MKKIEWLSLLFLLTFFCLQSICPAEVPKPDQGNGPVKEVKDKALPPKIKFREMTHDFGSVDQHTSLKHTFVFSNIGKGVLNINKVKAG